MGDGIVCDMSGITLLMLLTSPKKARISFYDSGTLCMYIAAYGFTQPADP
jgi:hypothetical protein